MQPKIFAEIAKEVSKPAKKRYETRRVVSNYPGEMWASDLVQMTTLAEFNSGFNYMLNVIDLFTRFAWSVPLKNKSAHDVLKGLQEIVKQNDGISPRFLWVDEGKEYYNKDVLKWCKTQGISMYSTHGAHKSAVVERFNRTIKTIMWREFIANNSREWVDILPILIEQYNNSTHRGIGTTPAKARKLNADGVAELWNFQYGDLPIKNDKPAKFSVGDFVRISRKKNVFEKGYSPSWTMEIFKVSDVIPSVPWTYHIKDLEGEEIVGSFYEAEIMKTKQTPDSEFLIENIIKTRTRNGITENFVKWLGYPDKFNSWVRVKK